MAEQVLQCIPLRRVFHAEYTESPVYAPEEELIFYVLSILGRAAHDRYSHGFLIEAAEILNVMQEVLVAEPADMESFHALLRAHDFEVSATLPVYMLMDAPEEDDTVEGENKPWLSTE